MESNLLRASIAVLALAASAAAPVLASDKHKPDAMVAVQNSAAPGEPGHGWRYFSDVAARRAIVISADGTYFLNRGKGGLQVVYGPGAKPMTPHRSDLGGGTAQA